MSICLSMFIIEQHSDRELKKNGAKILCMNAKYKGQHENSYRQLQQQISHC